MAFTQFTSLGSVLVKYELSYEKKEFLTDFLPLNATQKLVEDIAFALESGIYQVSEAAICENLIYPTLREVWKSFIKELLLWSHPTINAGDNLSGISDYLIAKRTKFGTAVVGKPILLTVEAKKENFEEGWGQCAAEMVAAQKISAEVPDITIYGIVTTGEIWQFATLQGSVFTNNIVNYDIFDIHKLYSVLYWILQDCQRQVTLVN